MNKRGFSFLGLMVLVTLMGVAGSIVLVAVKPNISTAGLEVTVKRMDDVLAAIKKYRADHPSGTRPPTLAYLFSDVDGVGCTPSTANLKMQGWCGPYLKGEFSSHTNQPITDGWGTVFEYDSSGNLYSWGANGVDNGGGGDDLSRSF